MTSFAGKGPYDPSKLAKVLQTSTEEIATTVGLGKDALQHSTWIESVETQKRLGDLVKVLNKVTLRFGSGLLAYVWYRSEPLSGFDGQTAMQLVQDGKIQQVFEYIEAVDAGVFA